MGRKADNPNRQEQFSDLLKADVTDNPQVSRNGTDTLYRQAFRQAGRQAGTDMGSGTGYT